jgi:hypothetical protein
MAVVRQVTEEIRRVETQYALVLTQEEAQILRKVLGAGVIGDITGPRKALSSIHAALERGVPSGGPEMRIQGTVRVNPKD